MTNSTADMGIKEGGKKFEAFSVTLPSHKSSLPQLFARIMMASSTAQKNPLQIAKEYMRAATRPGLLSPNDFVRLRLFDNTFYGAADIKEFVGEKRYRDLCFTVNYRHDWLSVLSNKAASIGYLKIHKIPTIPIKAIYMPYIMHAANPEILGDKKLLEDFLTKPNNYPMFGKPIEGQNSLGVIALAGYSPSKREVVTSENIPISIDALVNEIDTQYPAGYLFQPWAIPHPKIANLSGKRLATVRFLTILARDGAHVFRACWKIPSGSNASDNYWRSGNLLAQLDIKDGRITHVTSGEGLDMQEHVVHPDTKAPLIGFVHPQWEEMMELALTGARLMHNVPLIGWDIACTDTGPVIVEMNEHPDSFIMQFADRRGILDETFKKFIEFHEQNRAAYNAERKASLKKNF